MTIKKELLSQIVVWFYVVGSKSVSRDGKFQISKLLPWDRDILRRFMKNIFKQVSLPED
jgi:hypothetical protein